MFKTVLTLTFVLFFNLLVHGQERTVKGRVIDQDGQVLVGASVVAINNTNTGDESILKGTISDPNGNFSLLTQATFLRISYTGYKTQVLALDDRDFYTIQLKTPGYLLLAPTIKGNLLHPDLIAPIGRDKITALSPVAINEVLTSQTGIQFQSGSLNTNRLSIRGVGARSPFATSGILVYIDEIPVHDLFGESSLEDLGLSFFDEISIIKGHSGPGWGNGIGGAVRLNVNYPSGEELYLDGIRFRRPNPAVELASSSTIGAYGLQNHDLSAEWKGERRDGERFVIRAKAGFLNSDGYRANNQVDRRNVQSSFFHEIKRDVTLKGILLHTHLDAQIPSSLNQEDFEEDPRQAAFIWGRSKGFEKYERTLSGLTYTNKSTRISEISVSPFLHRFSSLELRPFNTLDTKAYTFGNRVKVKENFLQNEDRLYTYTGGLDIQVDQYEVDVLETLDTIPGDIIASSEGRIQQYNFYNKIKYSRATLSVELGLDLSYRSVPAINTIQTSHVNLSPHLDIRKRLGLEHKLFLRAGRGLLFPTPDQYLDGNGQFNTELRPSSGYNIELGFKRQASSSLNYQVSFYHMPIQDQLIAFENADGNTIWENRGNVRLSGLELSLAYFWDLGDQQSLSFEANHCENWHRFASYFQDDIELDGNRWTGSPNRSSFAQVRYQWKGWTLSSRGRYVGAIPLDDGNTAFNKDYLLLSTRLQYEHQFLDNQLRLRLFGEVENVGDVDYSPMVQVNAFRAASGPRYFYPGLPRNLLLNVSVTYAFQ